MTLSTVERAARRDERRRARHASTRAVVLSELDPALARINAMLGIYDADAHLRIKKDAHGPCRVELMDGRKAIASLDYGAKALRVRASAFQPTGAHLERQSFQEATFLAAIARTIDAGLVRQYPGIDLPLGTQASEMARATARNLVGPLMRKVMAARSYIESEALKAARRPSIKGRPAAGHLYGEAGVLADLADGAVVLERVLQACDVVGVLPVVVPAEMRRWVVQWLGDGRSVKALLRDLNLPWSIRHIRAGLGGLLAGADIEAVGRIASLGSAADILPSNTREQRWWLRLLLPLVRRWIADPDLEPRVLWLGRAAHADLLGPASQVPVLVGVGQHLLVDWLTDDPGLMPEPMRWANKLTLADGWDRARLWDVEREQLLEDQQLDFGPPWLPRGVVGEYEVVPLEDALALQRQGVDQLNCVSGYAWRVAAGRCYLYGVNRLDRRGSRPVATLELGCAVGLDGAPHPLVIQLLARGNREPQAAVVHAVDKWLATPAMAFRPHPAALAAARRFREQPLNTEE